MYIGIDLGTSNSAIAGVLDGTAQVFRPADGGEVLPSAIYIDKRGHRLYGRRAHDQALISPENVASGFKRLMGTATPIEIKEADVTLTPEECSAEIIRQLLGQATTELGDDHFDGAVIAIPAAFNQMQAEATLRAAKLAGLEKVDLIQEPVAAALAAMADAKRSGQFLVFDLGGGTFDVALLNSADGAVRIIAEQGVNMLGGRDFDRMIVHEIVRPWLLANFDLPPLFLRDPAYQRLARLALLAAEKAKIELSSQEETSIFVSDDEMRLVDQSEMEIFLDAPITRAQFEELILQPVTHMIEVIQKLLEENALAAADVDRVVFIGGSTRIPLIRRLVSETLGIAADLKTDPMTAVAEGAAYFCESRLFAAATELKGSSEASSPKPTEAHAQAAAGSGLTFDYPSRTPSEKATLTIRLSEDARGRQIRLSCEDWSSQTLPLKDALAFAVPLSSIGKKVIKVFVLDSKGEPLEDQTETLSITRVAAAPQAIPAAQTIAVKVRKSLESEQNSFVTLVKKGDSLPASGSLNLKSGTTLKSGSPGFIGFEVFQVEYPERVDLNLCIGLFKVMGTDLPKGHVIRVGEPMIFHWSMSQGGLLQTSVELPASKIELEAPRFYTPQAGEISYKGEAGHRLTQAILECAKEEWGELAAAVGPEAGPETTLLKARLDEQFEILEEDPDDAETARRVSEEARFIRQDTVRQGRKVAPALLQRQLGKLNAVFNRVARGKAEEHEIKIFDELSGKAQKIIDNEAPTAIASAHLYLEEMRRLFFSIAWRQPPYVKVWFAHLSASPWLYADQDEWEAMVKEGQDLLKENKENELKEHVLKMMAGRLSLSASDAVSELATVIKA